MSKHFYIAILCVILSLPMENVQAQIPPPDLSCVFNQPDGTDTLRWEIPVVNCGPIQGFEIYQSENIDGPYSLVQTINDAAAMEAVVTNTSNLTYFYYVLIDANCPGLTPISSDTLSNRRPPAVQITSVSVQNDDVLIQWVDRSDSISKIAGYVIYRVGTGTIPIDTVYGSISSYIDPSANPNVQSEIYFVQAIDGCGITGPIGSNPHATIHMTDSLSSCARALYFEWTDYRGWNSGVEYFELMVSVNGDPFFPADSIAPNVFQTSFGNLDARNTYTIFIRAKQEGEDVFSASNAITITPDISQGVQTLNLWGADVDNNDVNIAWNWNDDAELNQADLIVNPDGNAQSISLENFINPLSELNDYSFTNNNVQSGPIRMAIRTVDACDSVKWSDTIQTAYVNAIAFNASTNRVQISYPTTGNDTEIQQCELLRIKDGRVDERFDLTDTTRTFDDAFDGMDDSNNQLCYQLLCRAEASLPSGSIENFDLHSNVSCPIQEVRIQAPNAFRPEGVNNFFRPIFLFESSILEYRMQIFDRWGQLVFETSDTEEAWYGMQNGEVLRKGVYVYRISILQKDGTELEKQGTVLLLR